MLSPQGPTLKNCGTDVASADLSPGVSVLLKQLAAEDVHNSVHTLEGLYQKVAPLRRILPELADYAGTGSAERFSSQVAMREFPRMVGAFINFGIFLRACDGLTLLEGDSAPSNERMRCGREMLERELTLFSRAQRQPEKRLDLETHFIPLVRLFQPIARDPELIETIATALVMSDLCKMPHIKRVLVERIEGVDMSDHERALAQVLHPANWEAIQDIFPSFFRLSQQQRSLITAEIEYGANIGNLLQMEVGASALSGVRQLAQNSIEGVRVWILSSILDISSARAQAGDPGSWQGSELITPPLALDLVAFCESALNLSWMDERSALNSFWNAVAGREFYRELFEDTVMTLRDRCGVFCLARYLSLETDYSPNSEVLRVLSDVWLQLPEKQRDRISVYLQRSGDNPHDPRPTATYMIYMFTQLYAKQFPLPEALSRCLPSIGNLIEAIEDSARAAPASAREGMPLYSGEALWPKLQLLSDETLSASPLQFRIVHQPGMTPQIELAGSQ